MFQDNNNLMLTLKTLKQQPITTSVTFYGHIQVQGQKPVMKSKGEQKKEKVGRKSGGLTHKGLTLSEEAFFFPFKMEAWKQQAEKMVLAGILHRDSGGEGLNTVCMQLLNAHMLMKLCNLKTGIF